MDIQKKPVEFGCVQIKDRPLNDIQKTPIQLLVQQIQKTPFFGSSYDRGYSSSFSELCVHLFDIGGNSADFIDGLDGRKLDSMLLISYLVDIHQKHNLSINELINHISDEFFKIETNVERLIYLIKGQSLDVFLDHVSELKYPMIHSLSLEGANNRNAIYEEHFNYKFQKILKLFLHDPFFRFSDLPLPLRTPALRQFLKTHKISDRQLNDSLSSFWFWFVTQLDVCCMHDLAVND